jgi:hypothetical protein
MSADEIATAFVSHFYQTFSSGGAAQLAGLYVSKQQIYRWLLVVVNGEFISFIIDHVIIVLDIP